MPPSYKALLQVHYDFNDSSCKLRGISKRFREVFVENQHHLLYYEDKHKLQEFADYRSIQTSIKYLKRKDFKQ